MSDPLQALLWLVILGLGLRLVVGLYRAGLPSTVVRDLLHVGAGAWVLGWPWWGSLAFPLAIPLLALIGLVLVPVAAERVRALGAIRRAVTDDDERWTGLVVYAGAHTLFTPLGLLVDPVAAGGALWALSLGDGIGGAVGRRVGRTTFRFSWTKRKSVEGTAAASLLAGVAVVLAGWWFGDPVPASLAVGAGIAGGVSEAVAPRSTDNLSVPVAVWAVLILGGMIHGA